MGAQLYTMTPTATPTKPRRRIGRRLLGSGVAGALTTPHGVDRYLELVQPDWTLNEARARVSAVRRQTPDSVTLSLDPNDAWRGFRAGQFVNVTVEIDGVRRTRCYSPAGSAYDRGRIELTIRTHDEGLVSRHLAQHSRPGLVVGLSQAEGDFVLPAAADCPSELLLISGGSGITPVMAMLRTLCAEGDERPVVFLHYSPTPALTLYRAELADIATAHPNVRVVHAHTRAPGTGDLDGHLTPDHISSLAPSCSPDATSFADHRR